MSLNSLLKPWHAKTPTVLQMEALECGAASLAMILAYFKRYEPLEVLRLKCGVSRDGTKATNILKAARSYGISAKGYKKEPEGLRELPFPQIIFWNFNHFVVLEGFHKGKVYLNDPAHGRRVISDDEFDESFTGVVLTFEPTEKFTPAGRPDSIVDSLKTRFNGLHGTVAFIGLVGLCMVLPGLLIPVFTSVFVDKILVSNLQDWLRPLLLGMGMTAALHMLLTWMRGHYLLLASTRIALSESSKFFWHVLRLPVEFYTQRSAGDVGARVSINDDVATMLTGDLAEAALSFFTIFLFAALMFSYDVVLTLLSIGVVALNIIVLKVIAQKTRESGERLSVNGGKLAGASINGLAVMESIKASGGENGFFSKWAGYQAKYINASQEVAQISLLFGLIPGTLTAINSVLILVVGGSRVMQGDLSLGQLVAFQSLVASFTGPATTLVNLANKIQKLKGDMNRLDDIMDNPVADVFTLHPDEENNAEVKEVATGKMEGFISLKNIVFGYNRAGLTMIDNFNLEVSPGQRIAIVGPSGCGKSTVSKLLMGLYEPWEGEVMFDGKLRNQFNREQLSNSVSLVDQDIHLFEGSIRDNITLWDQNIDEADMVLAAKDARIHDFILERSGGYDAKLSEGARNMSGGQRQRLELARALCTNPSILILDEATSALDVSTELEIDSNLRRRGCTTIIIAHRLSTIRDADEIIVLSHGIILQRGKHEELMENESGRYFDMVSQQ
jgi:NHLM bacteriocin system ABC transporter peptidase/ATP-binding protein